MAQTTWDDTTQPATVSVIDLHGAARTIRRVARWAPHLDTTIRRQLDESSTLLDLIADREREVERVMEGGGA